MNTKQDQIRDLKNYFSKLPIECHEEMLQEILKYVGDMELNYLHDVFIPERGGVVGVQS